MKAPRPVCCSCSDTDAPHAHPRDAKLRLCDYCRGMMLAAEDTVGGQEERRIGDAGERARLAAGRQPNGGR